MTLNFFCACGKQCAVEDDSRPMLCRECWRRSPAGFLALLSTMLDPFRHQALGPFYAAMFLVVACLGWWSRQP